MAGAPLSQAEADALMTMSKRRRDDVVRFYPGFGGKLTVPLVSVDRTESFTLDVYRSTATFGKRTFQNRARKTVVLARLDIGSQRHRNPDGTSVGPSHLHLYRAGYGDRWAFPVPRDSFTDIGDPRGTLDEFLGYCNVVLPPRIEWSLFA